MTDLGTGILGGGLVGLLVASGYGLLKLLRRSKCASHTKCCDLDISRAQTERKKNEELAVIVLEILKQQPEGEEGEVGGHHVPPSSI